ncbi:hypothetical protein MNBD_NITROSPINAE01-271 [hydrothermal vent metagenome]|uniref:PilZ domain-containing protein n=1 Tax=hydrothermal vent metagenome TaxID=652676 RepID=A0A3B1BRC8_9ZZZZ
MDLSNLFPVNKKIAFRLSSEPEGENHYCLIKKTKDPLIAVVVSNKDKNSLSLNIGDNLLFLSEQKGETWVTPVKVAQNQSHPLIILHVEGEASPMAIGEETDHEISEEPEELPPPPAPISEIELIDGDVATEEQEKVEDEVEVTKPLDDNSNVTTEEDDLSDMVIAGSGTEKEIDIGDIEEDPVVENPFVVTTPVEPAKISTQVSSATVEPHDFFNVSVAVVEIEKAEKLAEAIENETLNAEGEPSATSPLPDDLDPAIKMAFERIGKIEQAVEEIRSATLAFSPSRSAISGTCIGLDASGMQIALSEEPLAGSIVLLDVNKAWHPQLKFTALAETGTTVELNGLFMVDFSFTTIHLKSIERINEYNEYWAERLKTLKEMALMRKNGS